MAIHFGTDGWRAVISDTFTFENVRLVAQAIADYVWESTTRQTPEVVIGFDTRFLSDRYAVEVARVMAGNNIVAHLTRSDTPTPVVSYAVMNMQCELGVMITASHNPPRYNGIKLKANFGGSALPDQCKRVEMLLDINQRQGRGPNLMDYQQALKRDLIRRFDPNWAYYEHITRLLNLDAISAAELYVVADAMYGAGRGAFRDLLSRTRCRLHEIRHEMNPGFGGIHPEPIAHYLQALAAAVKSVHADVGLATDGDADRIGAMDAQGNFVDPHHIFALSLQHLAERRGWTGKAVVRTVSTTRMIDRLAAEYGLKVYETPVGFNHIADYMLNDDILIGGEESGGISIKGHIPEGDGIIMGMLLLEVMATEKAPLHEIIARLQKRVGPAIYARRDIPLQRPISKKDMVARLTQEPPAELAGQTLREIITLDGVKYLLADEAWLLIRPSGTEPVLRVYAEGRSADEVETLIAYGESLAS